VTTTRVVRSIETKDPVMVNGNTILRLFEEGEVKVRTPYGELVLRTDKNALPDNLVGIIETTIMDINTVANRVDFGRFFDAKEVMSEATAKAETSSMTGKLFAGKSVEAEALQATAAKFKVRQLEKELYEFLLYTGQADFYWIFLCVCSYIGFWNVYPYKWCRGRLTFD